jgi:prevent-host-death family protein
MKTANATDIKNRFGEYLDEARSEPLIVHRNGRKVAVLLSWGEYARLSALEDAWWAARANAAEAEGGYLGPEKSMKALLSLLHEREK